MQCNAELVCTVNMKSIVGMTRWCNDPRGLDMCTSAHGRGALGPISGASVDNRAGEEGPV